MKILITGANGYIGSRLCQFLSDQGYSIIAACRSKPNYLVEWNKKIDQFILGDLSLKKTKNKVLKTKPDILIHLVSLNKNDSEKEINRTIKNNIKITWEMLQIALKLNVKQFINFSSVHAENQSKSSLKYKDTLPNNFYGLTHIIREKICLYYSQQYNMNCVNLRLSNSYGEPVFNIPKNWKLIISELVKSSYSKNKIVLKSDGLVKRNFIHYSEVCKKLNAIIGNKEYSKNMPIYLKSNNSYSLIQIALIIKDIFYKRFGKNISIYTEKNKLFKPEISDSEVCKKLNKPEGSNSIVEGINGIIDYLEKNS